MVNKKQIGIGIFSSLTFVLILLGFVSAIGVSMYYYENNNLVMAPGESRNVEIASLLAGHETQDKNVEIELVEESEIASVVDKDIEVVAGSVDNVITLKLSIPSDASIGTEYNVKIRVKEITPPEGEGMVGLTNSKVTSFVVEVGETEQETPEEISTTWWILGIVALIIIIAIVWMILKNKKEEDVSVKK